MKLKHLDTGSRLPFATEEMAKGVTVGGHFRKAC